MASRFIGSEVREAIRQAVALAARTPDYLGGDGVTLCPVVEWVGKRSAARWVPTGASIDLEMGGIIGVGTEETRYEWDGDPDTNPPGEVKLLATTSGVRHFTVTVTVDADSQEDGEDAVAFHSGRLRTRFKREEVLALLQAANVALISIGETINADYITDDGLRKSSAITDIRFATTEWDGDDPEDSTGDWIATAEGSGVVGEDLEGAAFDTAS